MLPCVAPAARQYCLHANSVCLESSPSLAGLNAVQEMEDSTTFRGTSAKSERTGWSTCLNSAENIRLRLWV